jgi:phospholipase A-2-activating protein
LKSLEKALVYLQNPAAASANFTASDYHLLVKLVNWPPAERFPGLDLLRLAVADSSVPAETPLASGETVLNLLAQQAELGSAKTARDANLMLGYRAVANLYATVPGRKLVALERRLILQLIDETIQQRSQLNGNCRLAIVTILLKYV